MAQRRHHYERAFEQFLRTRRIPYVAVDEAKKALVPDGAPLRVAASQPVADSSRVSDEFADSQTLALKSFDFVVYAQPVNLLLDVKGRKVVERSRRLGVQSPVGRLENWVTLDDVESLACWQQLFGHEFQAAFLFLYWCDAMPPDALFQEVMEYRGFWYAIRAVKLDDYVKHMKVRSPRWRTMDLPAKVFEEISQPFTDWYSRNDRIAELQQPHACRHGDAGSEHHHHAYPDAEPAAAPAHADRVQVLPRPAVVAHHVQDPPID